MGVACRGPGALAAVCFSRSSRARIGEAGYDVDEWASLSTRPGDWYSVSMMFASDDYNEAGTAGSGVGAGTVVGRMGLLNLATVRRFVFGIWMLWAVLLFGGTLLSELGADGASKRALNGASKDAITLVSHLGSSVLLVAAGWVWFLGFGRSAAAGTVALFAAGMTLGAIGDFFNAGVLQDLIKLPDPVLGGMAAFALGHVAYIAGCVRVSREGDFRSRGRWLAAIGFWQAVGTVAWFFVVYCGTNIGAACWFGRRCLIRYYWRGQPAWRVIWRSRTFDFCPWPRERCCFSPAT